MKPFLIFLALAGLLYFVPFWVILAIVVWGLAVIWLLLAVFMVFMDFFAGDE